MNITNKTILIIGGGSGIGLETAWLLSAQSNKVLLMGRTTSTLLAAANTLPHAVALPCFRPKLGARRTVFRPVK